MCENLRGCSVQERCDPANPALYPGVVSTRKEEGYGGDARENAVRPQSTWIDKWECQSDRSQVIGGKNLIEQLAPWVTWDI